MNAVKVKNFAIAAVGVAVLSGCASPPISKDVQHEAKQINFAQVRAYPDETRGQVVIWGGRIINVVNNTNASSIYIVGFPVDSDGKPVSKGPSPGRFIAAAPGFLDPTLLPHGRVITVAGSLNGVWPERLGKMNYDYPVLKIKELHVWPAKSRVDYPEPDYYSYPNYGYYGPGWNDSPTVLR
jgi:outer membrane lipoprotein